MTLEELRKEVNVCNKEIIQNLKKRFEITRKIGELKKKEGLPSLDKSREEVMFNNLELMSQEYGLNKNMIKDIFTIIISEVKKEHEEIRSKNNK